MFLVLQLYGQDTSDNCRPSALRKSELLGVPQECLDEDNANKEVLKAGKVRDCIICVECEKPRCVYSATRMTAQQVK